MTAKGSKPKPATVAQRISREKTRLVKQYADIGPRHLKVVDKLIDRVAFLTITLEDLEKTIIADGYVSEYKNGENQYGTKRSPEADLHSTYMQRFSTAMKQLTDMLPSEHPKGNDDPLMGFVNR